MVGKLPNKNTPKEMKRLFIFYKPKNPIKFILTVVPFYMLTGLLFLWELKALGTICFFVGAFLTWLTTEPTGKKKDENKKDRRI